MAISLGLLCEKKFCGFVISPTNKLSLTLCLSPSAKRGNLLACFLPSFSLGLIFFEIDVILT